MMTEWNGLMGLFRKDYVWERFHNKLKPARLWICTHCSFYSSAPSNHFWNVLTALYFVTSLEVPQRYVEARKVTLFCSPALKILRGQLKKKCVIGTVCKVSKHVRDRKTIARMYHGSHHSEINDRENCVGMYCKPPGWARDSRIII